MKIKKPLKITAGLLTLGAAVLILGACEDAATVASYNISRAADNFEIERQIFFYNGITDTYIAEFAGRCSIEDQTTQVEITCKVGEDEYFKHFQGLSDNVTYTALQVGTADVSEYNTRVVLRPQTIVPDFDLVFEGDELIEDLAPDGVEPAGDSQ